ncbi:MAG: SDR family oxidoreductase [Armatimonadetes bacterium]|nr:SDR family oxidoreductase [Armatimonadota bacterium]
MCAFALRGKTALVTGAAKRLGRACALSLAEAGANVVVHYNRSAAEAEALCADLTRYGVRAWPLPGDLARPEEAEGLLPRARALAGPVQVLVNNASIFDPSRLEDVSFDQVTENAAVNAWAPFALSRAFAAQGLPGRIVNFLDTRVDGYDWPHVAYILSKHLLAALTRMTALEYAPDITVNAVAPGLVLPPPGEDDSYLDRLTGSVPLQRHGTEADIARTVMFLLQSDFITGEVIHVDGGVHLRRG